MLKTKFRFLPHYKVNMEFCISLPRANSSNIASIATMTMTFTYTAYLRSITQIFHVVMQNSLSALRFSKDQFMARCVDLNMIIFNSSEPGQTLRTFKAFKISSECQISCSFKLQIILMNNCMSPRVNIEIKNVDCKLI